MFTLITFIIVLALLVFSHEFGHFIVARKNGIKVEEFGFGFPPRLFGVQYKPEQKKFIWIFGNRDLTEEEKADDTVYSFNLVPLGGFVKIKGEDGEAPLAPDSFGSKPAWRRASVLAAGVAMNIILAAVLLSVGFIIGMPQVVDDGAVVAVRDRHLTIIQVLPDTPAKVAGLESGDKIIQIGELNNPEVTAMQDYINSNKDQTLSITVKRGEEEIKKEIKPVIYPDTGKAGIGVAIATVGLVKYPWYQAIYEGIKATGWYLKEIIVAFYGLISALVVGKGVSSAVSGPVGIATMTGEVARLGWSYLLQFTAMLSLNLAVLNILPIPALDGGRLLFLVIGKIRRRPISTKVEQVIHSVGFMLLMLLVVIITVKDLRVFEGAFFHFINRLF
ncbi:MAG: Membrane-associated zinc metalloprotease [Candidatus Magasanikbacteria bacterium GW2011_GWA2_37_8]|uniref:Zinc metalloprotease n=1 Tax=Candidatus Magasanikbacteria bacterium GW2011_GWA2_37_8 TaxID=1619036 RepID=A0A0G0HF14_9BACT|nr:MAG: Membrane-associated zinc metalloprotease [Candidatus Magasanikbacteria bacterium GW2011_GWA2_37_8]